MFGLQTGLNPYEVVEAMINIESDGGEENG